MAAQHYETTFRKDVAMLRAENTDLRRELDACKDTIARQAAHIRVLQASREAAYRVGAVLPFVGVRSVTAASH